MRMAHHEHDSIPSAAALGGHPLHPVFVPLPIGALVCALGTDMLHLTSRDSAWARASRFLLGTALVGGAVAAPLGIIDFVARRQIREHQAAWLHGGGNALALALTGLNLALRLDDPERGVHRGGAALTAATVGLVTVTGWLGGELAYRHEIGLAPSEAETEPSRRPIGVMDIPAPEPIDVGAASVGVPEGQRSGGLGPPG